MLLITSHMSMKQNQRMQTKHGQQECYCDTMPTPQMPREDEAHLFIEHCLQFSVTPNSLQNNIPSQNLLMIKQTRMISKTEKKSLLAVSIFCQGVIQLLQLCWKIWKTLECRPYTSWHSPSWFLRTWNGREVWTYFKHTCHHWSFIFLLKTRITQFLSCTISTARRLSTCLHHISDLPTGHMVNTHWILCEKF